MRKCHTDAMIVDGLCGRDAAHMMKDSRCSDVIS